MSMLTFFVMAGVLQQPISSEHRKTVVDESAVSELRSLLQVSFLTYIFCRLAIQIKFYLTLYTRPCFDFMVSVHSQIL